MAKGTSFHAYYYGFFFDNIQSRFYSRTGFQAHLFRLDIQSKAYLKFRTKNTQDL